MSLFFSSLLGNSFLNTNRYYYRIITKLESVIIVGLLFCLGLEKTRNTISSKRALLILSCLLVIRLVSAYNNSLLSLAFKSYNVKIFNCNLRI